MNIIFKSIILSFIYLNCSMAISQRSCNDSESVNRLLLTDSSYNQIISENIKPNISSICFKFDSLVRIHPFNYGLYDFSEGVLHEIIDGVVQKNIHINEINIFIYDENNGNSKMPVNFCLKWGMAVKDFFKKNYIPNYEFAINYRICPLLSPPEDKLFKKYIVIEFAINPK